MDKRVIFAVAGSGKTTYIVKSLSKTERCLIITYTDANYNNLRQKILEHFDGYWPENIELMTYFRFLYRFCYKPFLADKYRSLGICYLPNRTRVKQSDPLYFMTENRYLYSNRIGLLLKKEKVIPDIKSRLKKYFDKLVIDEVQDIAGRDFNYLEQLMSTDMDMLFVGDFYQHTYDTSRDGNVNCNLFANRDKYEDRFKNKGFSVDTTTLKNSWRCTKAVCEFVRTHLEINIFSNRDDSDDCSISYISDPDSINRIFLDNNIIKLHYQKAREYGEAHKNWGEVKGEDCYQDVCVLLYNGILKLYPGQLMDSPPSVKNKLYVALTRAKKNVYLIDEKFCKKTNNEKQMILL